MGIDIDVNIVFRLDGKQFEDFHGRVSAEEGDTPSDLVAKIQQCIGLELFPPDSVVGTPTRN